MTEKDGSQRTRIGILLRFIDCMPGVAVLLMTAAGISDALNGASAALTPNILAVIAALLAIGTVALAKSSAVRYAAAYGAPLAIYCALLWTMTGDLDSAIGAMLDLSDYPMGLLLYGTMLACAEASWTLRKIERKKQ